MKPAQLLESIQTPPSGGWGVIRFTNDEVLKNADGIIEKIKPFTNG